MKYILPVFLFLSLNTLAQTSQNSSSSSPGGKQKVTSAKAYGYIDGIRLDSIDADYAEFSRRGFRSGLTFDYGQSGEKRAKMVLTDRDGNLLDFEPGTIAMLLNFFSFNGWDLAHVYNQREFAGGVDTFILKRRKLQ